MKDNVYNMFVHATNIPSMIELRDLLLQNKRFEILLRFVFLILLCILWCNNVGHPNVLVHDINFDETTDKKEDTKEFKSDSESENSPTTKSDTTDTTSRTELSGRESAEIVLQNPNSTFTERYDAVRNYIDQLAKPGGSLGTLEDWAARISATFRTTKPMIHKYENVTCLLFAGDHGIAADSENGGENCSAYPQSVTRSILHGLQYEIAGASVFAKANNVQLQVIDVGVLGSSSNNSNNKNQNNNIIIESKYKLPNGTKNACNGPAMTREECNGCILAGREVIQQYCSTGTNIFILGEVGIGNTTTSSLLLAALSEMDDNDDVECICDGGATLGRTVDPNIVLKKVQIIKKALKRISFVSKIKNNNNIDPMDILTQFGGCEIIALIGAIVQAYEKEKIIIIDGYIVTVAAAFAVTIEPLCCQYMIFASKSTEKGYQTAFSIIQNIAIKNDILVQTKPALDMNLRMGEGTAGLLVISIVRNAVDMICNMGTIEDILSKK